MPLSHCWMIADLGSVKTAVLPRETRMGIADRGKIRRYRRSARLRATGQVMVFGLLLCVAFLPTASGQNRALTKDLDQAQTEFDNGNFPKAIDLAKTVLEKTSLSTPGKVSALDLIAQSQIAQANYSEAENTLKKSLDQLLSLASNQRQKAQAYLRLSDIFRSQRDYSKALQQSRKALEAAPGDQEIQARFYLSIGRIMFSAGYDLSALIWLEKAAKLFESQPVSSGRLDTYRFLSLAWSAKMNYPRALEYSNKFVSSAAKSRFRYRYRQSLFEAATLLSSTGQNRKALDSREKGLKLSLDSKNTYQARNFLASLLLSALYDGDVQKASGYLGQLESLDTDKEFSFETTLGKAIISAFTGQPEASGRLFSELEKRQNTSDFILPTWKITIAEKNKEWEKVIEHNTALLELTLANNFREELPRIYLSFAKAYFHLGQAGKATEHLEKALSLIEEIRSSEHKELSLGLLEVFHNAYRLRAQIKLERPLEAFESSDYLKARLLRDKINHSPTRTNFTIAPAVRRGLEELSLKVIEDPNVAAEIGKYETLITNTIPELKLARLDLSELGKADTLNNTAIISYLFTLDNRLLAYVWEKDKPVRPIYLTASEDDIAADVKKTEQKIKNFIFFKRDGKALFDKLLKPLNLSAKHLIIVPDKHLWKIPFQALSPDGEKYLIEDKLVSYVPSVSILLEQLKNPKPTRRTLQTFANQSYNGQFLRYVNAEATSVAGLFKSRPVLNATVADFRRLSDRADILHFSMHAQVDNDQPLDSFLGFREIGKNSGRLTVEDLSNIRLKKGSLVFLASCDTNSVLNGEGLVSLAWGMMGAGATTVISAQWEANDKLTGVFTKAFYGYHKQGYSSAEALQKASLEMIKNKSNNMHEPYYWADFTLNGDYR
jgi:CHAT domain-containing protein/lipopolysaccharide biosynthesis regulator YciM